MAVTQTSSLIIVPAADAGATDLLANTGTGLRCKVIGIRWVGATTNAHTAVITDNNSVTLWASSHATAGLGVTEESNIPFWARNGLRVSTLGSGTLYIYKADS